MMRIAICDDDKQFLQEINAQLKKYPIVRQVVQYLKFESFLAELGTAGSFDAVFMDIDWGEEQTGIEYAERLFRLAPHLPVIYVTGYNDRFSQRILLKESNLVGYLTKPVDDILLLRYLQKVMDRRISQQNLTFQQQGKALSLHTDQIIFIESSNHTSLIHTVGAVYTVYEKLSTILPRLPKTFLQCHKSYIVNMRYIQRLEQGKILLQSGETVRVSRSLAAKTRDAVFSFLGCQV